MFQIVYFLLRRKRNEKNILDSSKMLQGGKMKWLQFHALSLKALNNLSKKEEIIKSRQSLYQKVTPSIIVICIKQNLRSD